MEHCFFSKNLRPLFLFALLTLVLFISTPSQATDFRHISQGDSLPDFALKDLENRSFSLQNLKGHDAILVFWNIPEAEMHRDYSLEELLMVQNLFTWYGMEKGLMVFSVYIPWHDDRLENQEIELILLRKEKYRLNIPILIDRGLTIFSKFGIKATPSTLMIDKNGLVTFTMSSYPWSAEKVLKKTVESQLDVEESVAKYAKVVKDKSSSVKVEEPPKEIPRAMSQSIWENGMITIFDKFRNDQSFKNPSDVAINAKGQLLVVDTGNALVHLYLSNGQYETSLGKKGFGGGKFVLPWGICLDDQDNIYVTDIGQHLIHIFDKYKRFLAVFGGKGEGQGKFNLPFDLDFYESKILVADTGNDQIQIIKSDFESQFGKRGRREGEFTNPTAVSFDRRGRIYVVDTDNNRIQVFSRTGKFLRKFGASGSGKGEFSRPQGIAVDSRNRIYVGDTGNHRLQVFDSEGRFLSVYGEQGSKSNQFNMPGKIFIDSEDNVFVVDTGNNRIIALNKRLFKY